MSPCIFFSKGLVNIFVGKLFIEDGLIIFTTTRWFACWAMSYWAWVAMGIGLFRLVRLFQGPCGINDDLVANSIACGTLAWLGWARSAMLNVVLAMRLRSPLFLAIGSKKFIFEGFSGVS